MNEFIKLLDKNLDYRNHKIINDNFYIEVFSNREEVICPYCGQASIKIHSHYERRFQDLPIQGNKVAIILNNRKMFCYNSNCKRKTFAESFDFISYKSKKTKRLEKEILFLALNTSSITAANYISRSIANVGKSTICNILKKRRTHNS